MDADAHDHARATDDIAPDDAARPAAPRAIDDGHVRLELHVSRSRAYDAYVRDFGSWWHPGRAPRTELHVEQHEGGALLEHAPNGDEIRWGEVHELEVGSRIRHSYRHAGEHPATVTVEFQDAEHGGAIVDVRHDAWEGTDAERAALADAWRDALRRLQALASAV